MTNMILTHLKCYESEMYGESNMGTYITICKTDSKWEVVVCFRELKQGLCTKLKVWDGGRNGREVQEEGDICIPMGEFNSDDHYIYYCGQEYLRRNGVAIIVNKRV